ncbi:SsrA-binding protein SmpB [Leptotrichia sp. oral taxon 218]|jgi:ssrA-binding protein|uniref:SsrA-binding protein SmpB n=1 Tax=Leptotrichia sp. oral taxon 218 TaxID=712361 RepID=UPI001B8CE10A|nr:SsrA-binding protein SmpB [Leptotrichia sp. oral taxon 218]QUB95121.1 SsrA-binding protein SmpB [Leptotrichia sp. oral taxon 218]
MILSKNKKAFHDYFIEEKLEAGIELVGTEVKSVKAGKISIKESFVRIIRNEIFIMNMHITPYEFGNINNVPESRVRKLLLSRREINKWEAKIKEQGYTIVPLSVYTKQRLVKVEIALAKGKKLHDKRETLKRKDIDRNLKKIQKDFLR